MKNKQLILSIFIFVFILPFLFIHKQNNKYNDRLILEKISQIELSDNDNIYIAPYIEAIQSGQKLNQKDIKELENFLNNKRRR